MQLNTPGATRSPTATFTGEVLMTPLATGEEPSRLSVALDAPAAHLAIQEAADDGSGTPSPVTWLEPVAEDLYRSAQPARR